MKTLKSKLLRRERRKRRVRKRIAGTQERPRLTVFRSHKNIYAQIIDDVAGHTLAAASSLRQRGELQGDGGNRSAARVVGRALAEQATQAGIKKVVFDRNGYPYHGRVRELADAAREGGLEF